MLLAIRREDGGVSIMRTVGEADPGECVRKWESTGFKAVGWHQIDPKDLPLKDEFRNAWESDGNVVSVNMVKARAIHLQNLRAARNAMLAQTDAEKLKLEEQGRTEQLAALVAKRQALRDMPVQAAAEMEAIMNPDALKAYVPDALK